MVPAEAKGCTALHVAAIFHQAGAIDVLVEAGANTERRISGGPTPFGCAAEQSNCEAMRVLLRQGANLPSLPKTHALALVCVAQDVTAGGSRGPLIAM